MTDQELIRALRCCVSSQRLDKCREECVFCKGHDMANCIPQMGQAVADRLAAYEDTGLEPEEITALIENDHVKYHLLYEYQQLGTIDYLIERISKDEALGGGGN